MTTHIYAQIHDGKVIAINDGQALMIELQAVDNRLLGTSYINGQFVGYKAVLTADKSELIADNTDTLTLTLTIKNWDDTTADDFNGMITLIINASRKDLTVTNGVATYAYQTTSQGTKNISTFNTAGYEYITHSSLTVQAFGEAEEL